MQTKNVRQVLNDLLNFKFDIDYMNNQFDYKAVWNDPEFSIIVGRKHYRHVLKLFIDGLTNSEMLRAWVYYMDQTGVFLTSNINDEDDEGLLNIRDEISAISINGSISVEKAQIMLNSIKDDWHPTK